MRTNGCGQAPSRMETTNEEAWRHHAAPIGILRRHTSGSVGKVGHFLWHLLQMFLAMMLGMAIYVALFHLILGSEAYEAMRVERPFLWYAEMAVFMTVPMVVLMRHHRYAWRHCAEMGGAMLVPPLGLIALVQLGVTPYLPWLSARTLPASTHIVMLVGMLGSMLYRRAEYTGGVRHRTST